LAFGSSGRFRARGRVAELVARSDAAPEDRLTQARSPSNIMWQWAAGNSPIEAEPAAGEKVMIRQHG